eukprot:g3836.t1
MANDESAPWIGIFDSEAAAALTRKDVWYRATRQRSHGFEWEAQHMPNHAGKYVMKMVKPHGSPSTPLASIRFCFVERGMGRRTIGSGALAAESRRFPLDGVYQVSYPGTSSQGRVIEVKSHMWKSADKSFVYHIDMKDKNYASVVWQSGVEQRTTWSGNVVPRDFMWSTTSHDYPAVKWELKGARSSDGCSAGRALFRRGMCAGGAAAGGRGGRGRGGRGRGGRGRGRGYTAGGRNNGGYQHGNGSADHHW